MPFWPQLHGKPVREAESKCGSPAARPTMQETSPGGKGCWSSHPHYLPIFSIQADQWFYLLWETRFLALVTIPECPQNHPTLPRKLNF